MPMSSISTKPSPPDAADLSRIEKSHLRPSSMAQVQPMLNRFAAISGNMTKAGPTILALLGVLVAPGAALAQNSAKDSALATYASASPPSNPNDQPAANTDISPEESAMLGNALTYDPAASNSMAPIKRLR